MENVSKLNSEMLPNLLKHGHNIEFEIPRILTT